MRLDSVRESVRYGERGRKGGGLQVAGTTGDDCCCGGWE